MLLLVPEIALTPAVAAASARAFGERVAIQHSGLSDGERHDQWQRIRRGDVDVVVGTRSAVFAPVQRLGLVIVDEEHDGSYKQEESPRYHGRDVAVVRARQARRAGACSARRRRRWRAITTRRAAATSSSRSSGASSIGRWPTCASSTCAKSTRRDGPDVILSAPLREAHGGAARARRAGDRAAEPARLRDRRCSAASAARTLECPNCSVSLTVHRARGARAATTATTRWPYRRRARSAPGRTSSRSASAPSGSKRRSATLFPDARVARVDRDTIRRRGAIAALLARFAAGEIDVLVGTQMIAKGHDFPRVTLVGVISADVGLGLADFRAGERTFQLLTQVAGRAGRGEMRGEAIVQTLYPDALQHPHACRQDYAAFFADEIAFRKAHALSAGRRADQRRRQGADTRRRRWRTPAELVRALRWGGEPYRVLGPAPAPLSRLKGEHRAQFFMKGTHRAAMRQALLAVLADRPELKRRTIVDVDPMSVSVNGDSAPDRVDRHAA